MTVGTKLTDEEFLALPDEAGKQELINGQLLKLPPAKKAHNGIAIRLFDEFRSVLHSSRVKHETGYQLGPGRWLQPDVSVIWPDQASGEWYEGSPMIAVEIASRGSTDEEIDSKVQIYLLHGAAEVWIIRPGSVSMTVYTEESETRYVNYYNCALVALVVYMKQIILGE